MHIQKNKMHRLKRLGSSLILAIFIIFPPSPLLSLADNLPVKDPSTCGYLEKQVKLTNSFSIDQIYNAIKDGDDKGLFFDLRDIKTLLDGTTLNPEQINGSIFIGPYPMEPLTSDYDYRKFYSQTRIKNGQGILDTAGLLKYFPDPTAESGEGLVALRVDLKLASPEGDKKLGIYDTFVRYKKDGSKFVKRPTVIEGPLVNLVCSDDPANIVITFKTGEDVAAKIILEDGREFADSGPSKQHEIALTGLKADTIYKYQVAYENCRSKTYRFKTAPPLGQKTVTFACLADSRPGIGGGDTNIMGVNRESLESLMPQAYRHGADFALFTGDLGDGYTTSRDDLTTQYYAWKQTVSGFWRERPIYTGMGNHEALTKSFHEDRKAGPQMDKWPYAQESSEAVFGAEFLNPANGPQPADSRFPPYLKTVYSFHYGPVKFIALNNNYWNNFGTDKWKTVQEFGGSPEGYILPDQLAWIKQELALAEKDPKVKYIIIYAHNPFFPNSNHVKDAMWYNGNNNVRAYYYHGGEKPVPADQGILDLRNDLLRAICGSNKVAAVLTSHEHCYHRTLINNKVPIGDPVQDDKNNNGIINEAGESCSPLQDLKYPTWFFVSGGAGAPFVNENPTPWNKYWKENPLISHDKTSKQGYYFSYQGNYLIIRADDKKISLKVYSPTGQLIDQINNLMAVKKNAF